MSSRNLFATMLMACVLAVGFHGVATVADAASAGLPVLKAGEGARSNVIEIKDRGGRDRRFVVPIAPNSAFDYPYYYSRGHYPTHIRPGYMYYGYPYSHYVRIYNARHGVRCSNESRRCVSKAGYRGSASSRRQRGAYR